MLYERGALWWIESAGGPLVLLSEQYLSAWLGHAPAWEVWMDPDATGLPDDQPEASQMTDYERAGMINGYIGVLAVGDGQGVVLSGDWLATAWLSVSETEGMLIRWVYGTDQAGLLERLTPISSDGWTRNVDSFQIGRHSLALFDAAWPGSEAPERITITLLEGEYTVDTAIVLPEQHTKLVLHRLRRH